MLNEREKKVIAKIQGDMPVTDRPYKALAEELDMAEEEFLEVLSGLRDRNIIRRFGATLKHQVSGYRANAMVAWKVAPEDVPAAGEAFAAFPGVSHCYHRNPQPTWPYNLYTMIHAGSKDECRAMAAHMSEKSGQAEYTLLFSKRELKKTSMEYFPTDDDD